MTQVQRMLEENLFSLVPMRSYSVAGSFLNQETESIKENGLVPQAAEDLQRLLAMQM